MSFSDFVHDRLKDLAEQFGDRPREYPFKPTTLRLREDVRCKLDLVADALSMSRQDLMHSMLSTATAEAVRELTETGFAAAINDGPMVPFADALQAALAKLDAAQVSEDETA
jgi:predicted transcriptional regulator